MRKPSPTIKLFNTFLKKDENDELCAEDIFSKECFQAWLKLRKSEPKDPEHAFRKAITGHCRGDCGLKPFEPAVETALLKILRRKKQWKCFAGSKVQIGSRGFQTAGYWEAKKNGSRKRKALDVVQTKSATRPKLTTGDKLKTSCSIAKNELSAKEQNELFVYQSHSYPNINFSSPFAVAANPIFMPSTTMPMALNPAMLYNYWYTQLLISQNLL